MWKHKSKWLVRGGRKVRCYLCGKKILANGDLFLFHGDTGYYSHQSCQAESTTISGNERRRAVKKIAVGAAVVGAIAAGAGKLIDVSSQSKNSPAAQTILTSQGLILPALTSDPANPVAGQMWYRSDKGVTAHFDAIENRVIYSNRIVNGSAVVTPKGIVNGLSVLPNDGQDWGPDTTKGATAPGQYGAPYTTTTGVQEGINKATSSGYSVELLSGQFAISSTITISKGVTIHGQGVFSYRTFNQYPLGNTSADPLIYETSTVIVNNTTSDAIDITVNYEAVNLDNFVILMKQAGGTGIKCSPSDTTTQVGMVYSHWGTVIAYSEVSAGSNYAFWFDNCGNNTFDNLQSDNMLIMHVNSISSASTGNSTFIFVFGQPPSTNTDNALKIEATSSNGNLTNLIYFEHIEMNVGNPTHHSIYLGTNVQYIIVSFLFVGTSTTSSLVLNNAGILYINYINNNGGTFSNSGNLTINTVNISAAATFDNSYILFIYKGLGNGGTVTISNTNYAKIGIDPRYYSYSYLPQATISTNPPASDTSYSNNMPYDIRLKIPVTYNPTSTEAATLATGTVINGGTMATSTKVSIPAGATAGQILTYEMIVPTGYAFKLIATNATIGTVEVEPVYD